MAAFNDNSDQRSQSEKQVSDATLASPKAGEQLQELLTILSELQLLKKSKKEPSKLKLPLSDKSVEQLKHEENRRNQLSFLIEPSASEALAALAHRRATPGWQTIAPCPTDKSRREGGDSHDSRADSE